MKLGFKDETGKCDVCMKIHLLGLLNNYATCLYRDVETSIFMSDYMLIHSFCVYTFRNHNPTIHRFYRCSLSYISVKIPYIACDPLKVIMRRGLLIGGVRLTQRKKIATVDQQMFFLKLKLRIK